MVAGILASAVQLYSIIPTLKSMGYKYERKLNFKDIYLKEASIMLMPIIIGLSVNRVNILIDKAIASTLPVGSISWLNYADDIIQLVLGIFITAIVTVFFPVISQEYNKEDIESLKRVMNKGVSLILKIAIPAMIILIILSEPIVKLLFERGEFGPKATYMTSQVLVYYALGLGSMALVLILTKIHYAIDDSTTPMKYGFIGVTANLFLNIILSKYMGTKGIALATSISTTLTTILLIKDLNNKIKTMVIHNMEE